MRGRTEEEKKEDAEIAEAVNRTLAEEAKEREEEKKREAKKTKKRDEEEKKERENETKGKKEDKDEKKDVVGKDEACPPVNTSCPVVEPCKDCPECPSVRCDPCPETKDCPPVKECGPCPEVRPCKPCKPCLEANGTTIHLDCPSPPSCVEPASMSVPEAMAVGAIASLLVTGVATAIGLLLRYAPPLFSGLLFVAIVVLTWYLSSHYPETARELGGRVVATLREATIALGHRVMEAIRHHDQVGVFYPTNPDF